MPAKKSNARELLFGDLWEFDPAPESAPAHIESRYGLFIGGKTVTPKSRKYFDSISPRDGKKLAEIPAVIFEKGVSPDEIESFIRYLHETKEEKLAANAARIPVE